MKPAPGSPPRVGEGPGEGEPDTIDYVPVLDAIVLSRLDPGDLLGLELHFLDAVGARDCRPLLIIYSLAGRLIAIGRYHLYGGPAHRDGLAAYRRLTGGRVAGAGEGSLGVALILPNRSALLGERDSRLKPDQVMNRYARGVMNGLRTLGLDCFYPGRDAITLDHRELAMCSFETNADGVLLFELMLAVNRGMEDLVHDLERFDPDGSLACAMYDRANATKLVRELGRDVTVTELTDAIEGGYAAALGEIERRELTAAERSAGEQRGAALMDAGWLHDRRPDAAFDRVSRISAQLGVVEARLALDRGGVAIDRAMLTGDFLANSAGLRQFERELAGQRFDLSAVSTAAIRTLANDTNYILGLGELANLVKLVMKAA
jgi:lipoate-protein ligase A